MSFTAKGGKNVQNQDKQTPHTVLQKLSPKLTCTPLKKKKRKKEEDNDKYKTNC